MAKVVRVTKFRHVFGQAAKRAECYDSIRITKSAWDSLFCAVNPKFVAIVTESAGGGSFLVLPLDKVGRVDRDVPLVSGHKAAVLDIAWCPHNDNIIASGSEDCTVKVWQIPDGGIKTNLTEASADLIGHQRRVGHIAWHPSALNVLLSAGSDMNIFIWDISKSEILSTISCHPEMILSVCWNHNGSRIVTSCKDKMFRVIDPRSGEVLTSGAGHQGSKPSRVIYLRDGRIFSTGFSKMTERQYAVWDENDLTNPLTMQELDSSNGIVFPIYDPDINVIYLCGKGDSTIKYFEYTPDAPYIHFLNAYMSADPQRGLGVMPKRGLHIAQCEIARFYKLLNNGLCEVISFTVPRKVDLFQKDLYSDTAAEQHAMTADEWIQGKNADPKLISIYELYSGAKSPSDTSPQTPHHPKAQVIFEKTHAVTSKVEEKPASDNVSHPAPTLAKSVVDHKPKPIVAEVHAPKTDLQYEKIFARMESIVKRMDDFDRRLKLLENAPATQHTEESNSTPSYDDNVNDDLQF